MRGRLVASTLVASLAVVVAGIALAAIPSADGTIHGCYKTTTKVLRVINAEGGQKCKSDERPLSWNQQGPPGEPSVSVIGGHSENFNISPQGTNYVDLFGGQVCDDPARCVQAMPADLVLSSPRLRAFTVTSHVSTALLINGTAQSLDCELTTATPTCTSATAIALSEGDLVTIAVSDADGNNDGVTDLRWTFEVGSPT